MWILAKREVDPAGSSICPKVYFSCCEKEVTGLLYFAIPEKRTARVLRLVEYCHVTAANLRNSISQMQPPNVQWATADGLTGGGCVCVQLYRSAPRRWESPPFGTCRIPPLILRWYLKHGPPQLRPRWHGSSQMHISVKYESYASQNLLRIKVQIDLFVPKVSKSHQYLRRKEGNFCCCQSQGCTCWTGPSRSGLNKHIYIQHPAPYALSLPGGYFLARTGGPVYRIQIFMNLSQLLLKLCKYLPWH